MSTKQRSVVWLFALAGAFLLGVWLLALASPNQAATRAAPARNPAGPESGEENEARVQIAPDTGPSGPQAGEAVVPVSLDIDLRQLPQVGPINKDSIREIHFDRSRLDRDGTQAGNAPDASQPDAVRQEAAGPLAMPASDANFIGLDFNNWGAGYPPDTNGDVGPNHYIQVVNTSIGIFDKATGNRISAFTFNAFFAAAAAPCNNSNNGDPVVLYDAGTNRWVLGDFAWTNFSSGPYYMCLAASKTGDPVSGGWWLYTFRADDASHPWLNDYPKIGLWSDGIYMSANMFDVLFGGAAFSYKGVRVWALNKDDLYSGAALRSVRFDTGSSVFSLLPSHYRGAPPPAGSPAYFVSEDPSVLHVWKFHVDWANTANSTFTGPTNVSVATFSEATGTVPVLNGNNLDMLGDRLMMQLQYRHIDGVEALWAAHTVTSGGVTGIRWYELRNLATTPTTHQQSTYQPADGLYRWMPSLAVDQDGNMAVGYSAANASSFTSIRYAGRLTTDALNTLGQGEATLITSGGAQNNQCGGAPCERWGDYASMSVDPVDDCTFWFTTEYYEASGGNWNTRIGSFKYSSCGAGGGPTPTPTDTATPGPTSTFTPTPTSTPSPTPTLPPSNTGFLSPASNAAQTGGDGNGYEVSPGNAGADDGVFAQDVNSGTGTGGSCTGSGKDKHRFFDYSISVPNGAAIRGIEVRVDARADSSANSPKLCVQLSWDGGASWTSAKSTATLTTSEAVYVLGSATDTWGRTWTTAQLSNANFRVRVIDVANGSGATNRDFSLDWVAVKVHFQ